MPTWAKWVVAVLATASIGYGLWVLRQIDEQTRVRLTITDIQGVVDAATERVNIKIENHWRLNMTLINEWNSGGEKVGVHTTQREGESDEDFKARHDAMVATRKKEYPPD